jgi:hypothetical protein
VAIEDGSCNATTAHHLAFVEEGGLAVERSRAMSAAIQTRPKVCVSEHIIGRNVCGDAAINVQCIELDTPTSAARTSTFAMTAPNNNHLIGRDEQHL